MHSRYGFWHFMLDLFLVCITGGLWLLYLIFRHFNKN